MDTLVKYIRAIHIDGSVKSPASISRVKYSYTANGPLYEMKSADVVRAIESRVSDYRLRNDATGEECPVAVSLSVRGQKCIVTTSADSSNDQLLKLASF